MKKVLACLMVVCALLAFGCSGRNAAFGVVDIKKVEAEAPAVKTIKEDLQKKAKELQEQMQKETVQDKSAQMQVASSEAQSKLKASLETALAEISKEKNLSAVLIKDAVPSGGVDVTDEVIKKMK